MKRVYNQIRDIPDSRDFLFENIVKSKEILPSFVDLRSNSKAPAILDQLQLGSCTANGASNALRYLLRKDKLPEFQPSRLYIYYFTRVLHGTVNSDSGASIRNTVKSVKQYGTCTEKELPYDITKFTEKPSDALIESAKSHIEPFAYYSVRNNTEALKNAVYNGFPVIFGFEVYTSFESKTVAKTGIVPMPKAGECFLGGHCVIILGYRDSSQVFICMNSWGSNWGDKGFFYLPYEFVKRYAWDFWTVNKFV